MTKSLKLRNISLKYWRTKEFKNKQRIEAEVIANKELMEKLAKTQAELLQTAIDAWREEELAKIRANPSNYIRTNMSENKTQNENLL